MLWGREECMDSGFILKVGLTKLINGLGKGYWGIRRIREVERLSNYSVGGQVQNLLRGV